MQTFAYRGRNQRGEEVAGTLQAASTQAAAIQLQNQAIVPVAIEAAKVKKPKQAQGLVALRQRRVRYDDLIMLCRQMRALTRAGVPSSGKDQS